MPPGEKDEFYLFYSGGHSGQVYVAGLPSMRHITTIPVFAPYPATGYGFDVESKAMMGRFTWGDVHHPGLSQSGGKYDGRWLFVNDNANNRIARIDLRDFKTKQILGPIPNSSGNHGSSFVTENSEYVLVATRFSVPLPKGRYADPANYKTEFNGMVSGIRIDQKTGEMSVGWQILTPPFNWDLGSTGKGPSSGWAFWTSYNSEMAHDTLEANSTQGERDYGAVVNWRAAEQAVKDGKAALVDGVPVIDPARVPGVIYFLPIPKSPHGIDTDPSGRWIAASGKLQPVTSVFDFEKIQKAIDAKTFDGDVRGVPVIKYEAVLEGEVPVGLGPLHTQYDGKGNAYTSLYVESAVAKWTLPPWNDAQKKDLNTIIVDKIPVHFNIGHLVVGGSDTREPYGKYLVAMNKLSKGRHISVGPSQPESSQLIDITGNKMEMLYEAYTEPEPHFAQILKADAIKPIEVYPKAENTNPNAVWDAVAGQRHAQRQQGHRQDGRHPQPLPARSHRREGRRRSDDPRDQRRADDRHDSRARNHRARHERGRRSGRDANREVHRWQARRLSVLLHQLLLRPPPGDAGVSRGQAVTWLRIECAAASAAAPGELP